MMRRLLWHYQFTIVSISCIVYSQGIFKIFSYGSLDSFPLLSRVARHDLSEEDGIRVLGSPVGGGHYIASFLGGLC